MAQITGLLRSSRWSQTEDPCPRFLPSPLVQQTPKLFRAKFGDAAWFIRARQIRGALIEEPGV